MNSKIKIGDRFIDPSNRKSKRVSTVYKITEEKDIHTGEFLKNHFYAFHEFMGQKIKFECSSVTVLRNKVE